MMVDKSHADDYLEGDYNESSHTSISTFAFQDNLIIECNSSGSLVTDTTSTSANSDLYHFPPSHLDVVQTAIPYYTPFENFHESTFSYTTNAESGLWKGINDCIPYVPESPKLTIPSPLSQRTNFSPSQTCDSMIPEEALHQESDQLPQSVASHVSSNSPQMTLTIDNPDLQTMTSILEVLSKAKSKVTMTMNR